MKAETHKFQRANPKQIKMLNGKTTNEEEMKRLDEQEIAEAAERCLMRIRFPCLVLAGFLRLFGIWRLRVGVSIAAAAMVSCSGPHEAAREHVVARQALQVWSGYEGYLESRTVRNVMSKLSGTATIIELAPEGATVGPGDLLVRFDSAQLDRDLLRLEKEYALAASDLHSLTNAKLPLEVRDLEMRLLQARGEQAAEEQFLADSRGLLAEGLIAEAEVRKQSDKVEGLRLQVTNLQQQLDLTRNFLHPELVERARTTAQAAAQELALARLQLSNCVLQATSAGVVLLKPISVAGEYRTVRVGDSLFKNQPFMALPDMTDLVVHLDVPESELAAVRPGQAVVILPRSFPDLRLAGRVESVGAMASSRADRPAWQKFFHVVVALQEARPELRSGMSVLCRVLVHDEDGALAVPRVAVRWDENQPWCRLVGGARRDLALGPGNDQWFSVRGGLQAGDRVLLP